MRWYQLWSVEAIPIAPRTRMIALTQVSVARALLPVEISESTARVAAMFRPIRATIDCLMSPPTAAELTARNGNAESTASAANANELFMKSAAERWFQNLPG